MKRTNFQTITALLLLFLTVPAVFAEEAETIHSSGVRINQIASFISGLGLPSDSVFFPLSQNENYRAYQKNIQGLWNNYNINRLEKIKKWRISKIQKTLPKVLFYPFSGPDILNALAFFPDQDEYIMVGLETPGTLPEPDRMNTKVVYQQLAEMQKAMKTVFLVNFFRTNEMKVELKDTSFSSISSVMLFFLARSGNEILSYKKIALTPSGQLVSLPKKHDRFNQGIEIVFKKIGSDKIQTVKFFSVDLSDGALKKTPHLLNFMKKYDHVTCMLKSASYLMHYNDFSSVRNLILDRAVFLLQDDSGIPYKFFGVKNWITQFYGKIRVLDMFKSRNQPELNEKIKNYSLGLLPFAYGYGFSPEKSHLMIIRKQLIQAFN